MSKVEKLSIRGIRSFSPDDEQVIEFYSPITMIVGANGSGKTTIIECLKYACTGEVPPAASAGKSWVHDPNLTDSTEVKAAIKMRFRNRAGHSVVIIRSLQLTQKKTALTFKALEGVMRMKDAQGAMVSTTSKCTALNIDVPIQLGVTSAVLESVIFCHQEDSSWPLQDSATLKKKFDDIFESTRYTKALDAIEKTRKQHMEQAKQKRITLAGLQAYKKQAMDIQQDLEATDSKIQHQENMERECSEKVLKLEKEKEGLQKELDSIIKMENTYHTRKTVLAEKERNLKVVEDSLPKVLKQETDEKLRDTLRSFDATLADIHKNIEQVEGEIAAIERTIYMCEKKIRESESTEATLQEKKRQLEKNMNQRDQEIRSLCSLYTIPFLEGRQRGDGAEAKFDEREVKSFLEQLRAKHAKLQKDLQALREQNKGIIEDARAAVVCVEAELNKLDISRASKEEERSKLQREFSDVENTMKKTNKITDQALEKARRDAEEAEKDLKDMQGSNLLNEVKVELQNCESRLKNVDERLTLENKIHDELRENANQRTKAAGKEAQIKEDEEVLQVRIKDFNERYTRSIDPIDSPTVLALDGALEEASERLKTQADKIQGKRQEHMNLQREVTEKSMTEKQKRKELEKMKKELNEASKRDPERLMKETYQRMKAEEEVEDMPEENDYEGLLQKGKEQLKEVMGSSRDFQSYVKFFGLLLKDAEKSKKKAKATQSAICPCCLRDMDDKQYETFRKTIEEKSKRIESKSKDDNRDEERWENYINTIEECLPKYQRIEELGPLVEELEREVTASAEKKDAVQERMDQAEKSIEEEESISVRLQEIVKELEILRLLADSLQTKQEEFGRLQSRLQSMTMDSLSITDGRSMEQVEASIKQLQKEKDNLTAQKDALKDKRDNYNRRLMGLQQSWKSLQEEYQDKKQKAEVVKRLEARKVEIKTAMEDLAEEAEKLKQQMVPVRAQLQKQQAENEKERNRLHDEEAGEQRKVLGCKTDLENFKRLLDNLAEAIAEDVSGQIKRVGEERKRVQDEKRNALEEKRELEPRKAGFMQILDNNQERRKLIEDNLKFRIMQREFEAEAKEVRDMKDQLDSSEDSARLRQRVQSADQKWREEREKKARINATIQTLKTQHREFRYKLQTENYKDVNERCRNALIEVETTEMAAQDLSKYHKALDKALLRYHSLKIGDINRIINEIWAETYQGKDIEEIMIQSGNEGGPGTNRATRSYNYRVMMKKSGQYLEMRGRCSAGQRVLASLVIRLALAETFCLSCGVMALDEPTTNLDEQNKHGLATALAKIISTRSQQSNFQIIVITHDEEFVDSLKMELSTKSGIAMPEHYIRIAREEVDGKFYSQISKHPWADK